MDINILVKKAKTGDKEALVQLIMSKQEDYYKLAYVYMQNPEDSMDAMEDMILIIYENINSLRKEDAFYSWSKSILVNCCKNILRKRNKLVLLDTIKQESYKEPYSDKDDELMLEKYLSQLNQKHQEVIKLRYFLDLDYKTISDILKTPIGTVKSRISIALKKLKQSFGGENL